MPGRIQDNGISSQFVSLPRRIEMSYPVRSSSLLSDTSLLWSMRGISRLKPLLSHFFLKEITILAAVRLLGGVRTLTGASHAWLTPCPGRRHPFRTHQLSWHFERERNALQVLSALCDTQEPPLSGSFRPVSCTTAGGRCNKEGPREIGPTQGEGEWRGMHSLVHQGAVWVECVSDKDSWRVGSVRLMPQWRLWQLREQRFCGALPVTLHIVVNAPHSRHSPSCLPLCSRLIKNSFFFLSRTSFCQSVHCVASYCGGWRTSTECQLLLMTSFTHKQYTVKDWLICCHSTSQILCPTN